MECSKKNLIENNGGCWTILSGSRYSRMDQIKFVEDSL